MTVKPSNSDALSTKSRDLVNQIISEDDPSKLKDLTDLFEMNQRKKNIARMGRLSDILEMVDDEVITRLSTVPDSMSDKDLVGYMTAAQKSMDSIKQSMDATPLVQINNQKIEIHNDSGLNRESRKKVLDAVMAIIENVQASDDVIEIEGEEAE